MPSKLIDAEAAKAAILELTSRADDLPLLDVTPEIGHLKAAVVKVTVTKILATLDALPDASEGFFDYVAKEAHRTGKSPQQVFAAEWEAHARLKDDSLWPDASEKAIHAERIPVPPHLAEAQRVVIARALKRQEGE